MPCGRADGLRPWSRSLPRVVRAAAPVDPRATPIMLSVLTREDLGRVCRVPAGLRAPQASEAAESRGDRRRYRRQTAPSSGVRLCLRTRSGLRNGGRVGSRAGGVALCGLHRPRRSRARRGHQTMGTGPRDAIPAVRGRRGTVAVACARSTPYRTIPRVPGVVA
jgi:hypothetical protein